MTTTLQARGSLKLISGQRLIVSSLSGAKHDIGQLNHVPFVERRHASQSSGGGSTAPVRKQITVASDDGRVRWGDLSVREKAARSTQQSVNFFVVLAGVIGTGAVAYVLYREVFASDSKTSQFNRAFDQALHRLAWKQQKDEGLWRAYMEQVVSSKANRVRKSLSTFTKMISNDGDHSSNLEKDRTGTQHLRMHFNVEGPENKGVVSLHMTKTPSQHEFEYKYLVLDVKGHDRVYLEDAEGSKSNKGKMKMFGVSWS
ncbi:MAG: hypothetical protein M4579_006228 [Chaenotheca gracillima]|nr:MAG: hypothetical protein M4579_006228 [Chaenotheca gracillima]